MILKFLLSGVLALAQLSVAFAESEPFADGSSNVYGQVQKALRVELRLETLTPADLAHELGYSLYRFSSEAELRAAVNRHHAIYKSDAHGRIVAAYFDRLYALQYNLAQSGVHTARIHLKLGPQRDRQGSLFYSIDHPTALVANVAGKIWVLDTEGLELKLTPVEWRQYQVSKAAPDDLPTSIWDDLDPKILDCKLIPIRSGPVETVGDCYWWIAPEYDDSSPGAIQPTAFDQLRYERITRQTAQWAW